MPRLFVVILIYLFYILWYEKVSSRFWNNENLFGFTSIKKKTYWDCLRYYWHLFYGLWCKKVQVDFWNNEDLFGRLIITFLLSGITIFSFMCLFFLFDFFSSYRNKSGGNIYHLHFLFYTLIWVMFPGWFFTMKVSFDFTIITFQFGVQILFIIDWLSPKFFSMRFLILFQMNLYFASNSTYLKKKLINILGFSEFISEILSFVESRWIMV